MVWRRAGHFSAARHDGLEIALPGDEIVRASLNYDEENLATSPAGEERNGKDTTRLTTWSLHFV